MRRYLIASATTLVLLAATLSLSRAVEFPGPPPGTAKGNVSSSAVQLENAVLEMRWDVSGGHIKPIAFKNKLSGTALDLSDTEIFQLVLGDTPMPDTKTLKASDLRVLGRPELMRVAGIPSAIRAAERLSGWQLRVRFAPTKQGMAIEWKAWLRDGSNYLREETTLRGGSEPVEIVQIILFDATVPEAEPAGTVDGAPAVAGQTFFGYESPLAKMTVAHGRLRGVYPFGQDLWPGDVVRHTSVIGVYPAGQQRRGFLYYMERERARPYHPFLHHNCGEDAKLTDEFHATQVQWWRGLIDTVGTELVEKRGVHIDAFVHDWDWDDEKLGWQFHSGFPDGFAPLRTEAEKFGAPLGIWLSPWGGYSERATRIKFAEPMGMEVGPHALSLAGPRYYSRFRDACVGLLKLYGMAYFKFDGFNDENDPLGSTAYRSDSEALIRLIRELRGLKPDVFINPSSGSWPSPFWLLDVDAVWRGGGDTGEIAKGSPRQRFITYRDSVIHDKVLGRSPLYPITSLMIHGIMINSLERVKTFVEPELVSDIRGFFATGTNLQELYITPDLMNSHTWDVLAEAAKWARANSEVLADTHWIGGSPAKYEAYGRASWSKEMGIIGLRNPDDQPAQFNLDVGQAFELPQGAPTTYDLTSPWKEDAGKPALRAIAGQPITIELAPFQVLVYDARPVK